MEVFYDKLREILEIDAVSREDEIGDIENWDSLGVLAILAMLDSVYKVTVSSEEIAKVRKVGDLEDIVRAKTGK
jgi:acyl carrier protein